MKKVFKTLAVFGLLGLAVMGCTKENVADQAVAINVNAEINY